MNQLLLLWIATKMHGDVSLTSFRVDWSPTEGNRRQQDDNIVSPTKRSHQRNYCAQYCLAANKSGTFFTLHKASVAISVCHALKCFFIDTIPWNTHDTSFCFLDTSYNPPSLTLKCFKGEGRELDMTAVVGWWATSLSLWKSVEADFRRKHIVHCYYYGHINIQVL